MRRRLLIARALVHRPRLALLDEPTAGVDLELRHELWRYLRKLHGEEGLTVLLTTHSIEEGETLCEQVALIRAGRIVAQGAPAELVERYGGERLEDVLSSPLRAWQLALAYMAGGLVRRFAAALAVVALAVPFVGGLERPAIALRRLPWSHG